MDRAKFIKCLETECANLGSKTAWALKHGVPRTYLMDVLANRRPPSERVLDAMGFEYVEDYRRVRT